MNGHNDFEKVLYQMVMQQMFGNVARDLVKEHATQKLEGRTELRQLIECNPNIETAITDTDMLLWRIDMALDNGDEVTFDLLVQELEGVE